MIIYVIALVAVLFISQIARGTILRQSNEINNSPLSSDDPIKISFLRAGGVGVLYVMALDLVECRILKLIKRQRTVRSMDLELVKTHGSVPPYELYTTVYQCVQEYFASPSRSPFSLRHLMLRIEAECSACFGDELTASMYLINSSVRRRLNHVSLTGMAVIAGIFTVDIFLTQEFLNQISTYLSIAIGTIALVAEYRITHYPRLSEQGQVYLKEIQARMDIGCDENLLRLKVAVQGRKALRGSKYWELAFALTWRNLSGLAPDENNNCG